MPEQPDPKIKELEDRLDALVRTQIDFQQEITAIRRELIRLNATRVMAPKESSTKSLYVRLQPPITQSPSDTSPLTPKAPPASPGVESTPPSSVPPVTPRIESPVTPTTPPPATPVRPQPPHSTGQRPPIRESVGASGYELPKRTPYVSEPVLSSATTSGDVFSRFVAQHTEKARENLEEFVGKNLISLIGIVVLILGVGIGAKYAIDNNWISPLTRIVIGYIFGFGLVGLAIKLKKNYHNFSAVLFSGGMAIMYFVTYFAYSAYGLISQMPTFGLMIMFTAFTVAAALIYSRQVIAHIGLVGAYAVPFLLSTDSGNYLALFVYMTVVNTGILAISVKKDWKPIFFTASFFTWAIFCGWFFTKYSPDEHFNLALVFLAAFFGIFYATKLAQLRFVDEEDTPENLIPTILTTVIFYGMCFAIAVGPALEPLRNWAFFVYIAAAVTAVIGTTLRFSKEPHVILASWFCTWAIVCGWFAMHYSHEKYFTLALVFLGVFFAIFYGTTLLQGQLRKDEDPTLGTGLAILTGIVFYGACFAMLGHAPLEESRYWVYFTYLAVASLVMLASSFKFYGRAFMYLVVPFVWGIFGYWFGMRYDAAQHFDLAAVFAALFFAIIYFSILFHRLAEDSFSLVEHTSLILANGFIFYGFGYAMFDRDAVLNRYLGLYTACSALLHLAVLLAVRAIFPKAVDVVQVLTILVLTLASIAVPVQFDGNVVTMVWAAEAAVLFWYGRTQAVRLFERFSYPVMILATGSLLFDWSTTYWQRTSGDLGPLTPFANVDFVTAIVYVAAFAFIYVTNRDKRHEPAIPQEFVHAISLAIATAGILVLYNMFRAEIANYFFFASVKARTGDYVPRSAVGDLELFDIAWQINYTLFFLTAMAVVNSKKLRSTTLAMANCVVAVLGLAAFATVSLFIFYVLREAYVAGQFNPDFIGHWMYIGIRPISYVVAGGLLYLIYQYSRDSLLEDRVETSLLRYAYDALAYTFVFVVASCELLNLMRQFGIPDGMKLGLSILWGVYALMMIVVGIARDKKHLRIAAIVLLAVTLAKLFFYDIADLDTISKTILFVTLGATLLVISFLYNKYKGVMFKTDAVHED